MHYYCIKYGIQRTLINHKFTIKKKKVLIHEKFVNTFYYNLHKTKRNFIQYLEWVFQKQEESFQGLKYLIFNAMEFLYKTFQYLKTRDIK